MCRGSLLHSPHDRLQSCQTEILRRPCVVSCKWISKHANQSFVMLIISLMGFLPWLRHFMVQKHLWSVRSWCAIFLVWCIAGSFFSHALGFPCWMFDLILASKLFWPLPGNHFIAFFNHIREASGMLHHFGAEISQQLLNGVLWNFI